MKPILFDTFVIFVIIDTLLISLSFDIRHLCDIWDIWYLCDVLHLRLARHSVSIDIIQPVNIQYCSLDIHGKFYLTNLCTMPRLGQLTCIQPPFPWPSPPPSPSDPLPLCPAARAEGIWERLDQEYLKQMNINLMIPEFWCVSNFILI